MRKTLYCGVDLHSNNAMYVIADGRDKQLLAKRLPNQLPTILETLTPFRSRLKVVAVESTYNWYWLVDGLVDHGYPVGPGSRSCRPATFIRKRTGRCGTCCGEGCSWCSSEPGSF